MEGKHVQEDLHSSHIHPNSSGGKAGKREEALPTLSTQSGEEIGSRLSLPAQGAEGVSASKDSQLANIDNMVGGRLKPFYLSWTKLTSDKFLLNAVKGYELEFDQDKFPPSRDKPLFPYKRNTEEMTKINKEIQNLENKGVIESCLHSKGEFLSQIFTRMKKNGGVRLILDLSELNKSITYQHFKMDNIYSVMSLLSQGYFMASVDLRDAYYTVPIHADSRKYLRFFWNGQLWQYKALPNGLSSAPRLFTKLLKPLLATLRKSGYLVLAYLDDTIIIGKTKAQTERAVKATTELLSKLGFIIHPDKSVLEPSHEVVFLGFKLNTLEMTITLPEHKSQEIREVCKGLLRMRAPSIREVARVIGKLVATFPAAQYGPLHYRALENDKITALKGSRGHFDRPMQLSAEARNELEWWATNIHSVFCPLAQEKITLELRTDASGSGWGATDLKTKSGGRWNSEELIRAKTNEINYLETLAAGFGLKAFCPHLRNAHVLPRIDNTTDVAYLNHMGGIRSPSCNEAALQIWGWCSERNIWITAAHLPGTQNTEADYMSRKFNDNIEWTLDKNVFDNIVRLYGLPEIDLFASRLNAQLPIYVSWMPDPTAWAVDAFTLDWGRMNFYAFPPFSLVPRCLQKIRQDKARGLLIVPNWPTQAWFPILNDMLLERPLPLPRLKTLLTQPVSGTPHPFYLVTPSYWIL